MSGGLRFPPVRATTLPGAANLEGPPDPAVGRAWGLSPSPSALWRSSTAGRKRHRLPRIAAQPGRMGNVIAFVPASGGVGASTLAAAVAVRASSAALSTVAVDLDRISGRLDVVFAVEQHPGWRWNDLDGVDGVVDGEALGLRLPSSHGVRVLAFDHTQHRDDLATPGPAQPAGVVPSRLRPAGAATTAGAEGGVVGDVVTGLARSHDLTVLDLPRDRVALEAVAGLLDAVVLVVGSHLPQIAAAAATMRTLGSVLGRWPGQNVGAGGVATRGNSSWSSPPAPTWLVLRGQRVSDQLADVVVDHLDLPLAGTLRADRRLASALEQGLVPGSRGRGSLVEVADHLLLRLTGLELAA